MATKKVRASYVRFIDLLGKGKKPAVLSVWCSLTSGLSFIERGQLQQLVVSYQARFNKRKGIPKEIA
jgi:hypothetical protein